MPLQAIVVRPPEGGESEVLPRYRAAEVDGDVLQGLKGVFLQEITHAVAGGVIENQPESAFLGGMIGQQNDRTIEDAVVQGRIREQDLALQLNGSIGVAHTLVGK